MRSRKLEVGRKKSEVRSWKSEVRNNESEIKCRKLELGSKSEVRSEELRIPPEPPYYVVLQLYSHVNLIN